MTTKDKFRGVAKSLAVTIYGLERYADEKKYVEHVTELIAGVLAGVADGSIAAAGVIHGINIGDKFNTEAFGSVTVVDVYSISPTTGNRAYLVSDANGNEWLVTGGELQQ